MLVASELKAGMVIRMEGQIYRVLEVESRAGAAKLGGVVKAKLSNVRSGRIWEPHLRPQERVEELQIEVSSEILGPAEQFLQAGMQMPVEFFEGVPISAVLPDIMEARVADTAPAARSQQDSAWKEARLDNSLVIRVPLFIAPGESVRVDLRTGQYVERAHPDRKRIA